MMSGAGPIARAPALRLVRSPRAWFPIGAYALIGIASAFLSRSTGGGADHAMRGPLAFLVLPLVAYACVNGAASEAGLRRGIRGVVALGGDPTRAAFAAVGVAIAASTACGALLAPLVCAIAHGPHDPPLAADLFTSFWVGALGGAAYAAYFSAGSAIGKGRVRALFLALDLFLGESTGAGALLTPRGHVQSLLGGPLADEVSQRASSFLLLVLVLGYASLAIRLARRA